MQTQSKHTARQVSSKSGIHFRKRVPAKYNRYHKGKAGYTIFGASGLHLLNDSFKALPALKVLQKQGEDELFGSKAKQIRLAKKLYRLLKSNPSFIDKDSWTEQDCVSDVLVSLFSEVTRLKGDEEWVIDKDEKGNYDLFLYYESAIDQELYHAPLEFLPQLKDINSTLHDLVIQVISLLHKQCQIPLWDSDEFQNACDYLTEVYENDNTDEETKQEYLQLLENYKSGLPSYYLNLIYNDNTCKETFYKNLLDFVPRNEMEEEILIWIKSSKVLLDKPWSLTDFNYRPCEVVENDMYPVHLDGYIGFVWSNTDLYSEIYINELDSNANEYGCLQPYQRVSITKSGWKYKLTTWPQTLACFLDEGIRILYNLKPACPV